MTRSRAQASFWITVGVNEKTGGATDRNDPQGRLRLLDKNAEIYRHVVPRIVRPAPVVSDPPDPLADVARETCPGVVVLSTGTYLDSQRFRVHLGKHFGVDAAHVEAQVIGDHGTSQVFLWSSARVRGVPIASLLRMRGERIGELRQQLEREVRYGTSRCGGPRFRQWTTDRIGRRSNHRRRRETAGSRHHHMSDLWEVRCSAKQRRRPKKATEDIQQIRLSAIFA
jgi:lactate/malate dehydrogenase, alpha/beta C-terminal domain